MKLSYSSWLSAVLVLLTSCSRHNEEMFLPQPMFTIYSPQTSAVVHLGDTIYVDAMATSAATLHGYELTIRKPGGSNLYFQHFHDHNDTLFISDRWKNNVPAHADLELLISVILDHEDHRKNLLIPIQVRD